MTTLTLEQAEDLAARTFVAIDADAHEVKPHRLESFQTVSRYMRERVASDLAGLRHHADHCASWAGASPPHLCDDARRYADGLLRTAALYGVRTAATHRVGVES